MSKTDSGTLRGLEGLGEGVDMPGKMPKPKLGNGVGKGKGKEKDSTAEHDHEMGIAAEDVLGYVSFRFDTEETTGPKDAEVIYWSVYPPPCTSILFFSGSTAINPVGTRSSEDQYRVLS